MYPEMIINLSKLESNLNFLVNLCHSKGLTCAMVTKVFCADEKVVELVNNSKADMFADSRIINLRRIKTTKPKMLLRISAISEINDVLAHSDISLQSEIATINMLGEAAEGRAKKHKVVLMIDLGDLREGRFFENEEGILAVAKAVLKHKNLELYGVGTNLTCYGGILPDEKNLTVLANIAQMIRDKFSIELPFVSGGNSSTLEFLKSGGVPKGITNLRLGESFALGKDTALCELMEGMYGDAITLNAELVEIQMKPSKPIGITGRNAFGEEVSIEDKGIMRRGILAIGRQDTNTEGLEFVSNTAEKYISIVGASSDHLLVDLTNAELYNVGDTLRFTMDYGAVLRSFTSEYVSRKYIK
ncbi:MAG: alanine/ornithine racemase family PLP-dependent enzyme [Clostridiales bacterium]|nr:alanine/ornithine racemase family PLP-dependent enzyme [Clostridiales bacterium]